MIDWQRVNELRTEVGEDDFPEIVTVFLEEVDEVIDRLSTSGAVSAAPDDMHFLKGSARTLGFSEMAELCRKGELVEKGHPAARISPVIAAYQRERCELLERSGIALP